MGHLTAFLPSLLPRPGPSASSSSSSTAAAHLPAATSLVVGAGATTIAAVSRWEQGKGRLADLTVLFLELLSNVLTVHPPTAVVDRLRKDGPQRLAVLRALADLEWHPTLPAL